MTSDQIPGTLTTTRVDAIVDYLNGAGVQHELIEHRPVSSAGAEAQASGQEPQSVSKTIVLHDGQAYVIAAIPATDRLDLGKLRDLLGATRQLRLASEVEIAADFPTLEVGAVPPFGPMVPAAEVIDRDLLRHARVLFPAGDRRHSVLVDPREVVRITAAQVADICEE